MDHRKVEAARLRTALEQALDCDVLAALREMLSVSTGFLSGVLDGSFRGPTTSSVALLRGVQVANKRHAEKVVDSFERRAVQTLRMYTEGNTASIDAMLQDAIAVLEEARPDAFDRWYVVQILSQALLEAYVQRMQDELGLGAAETTSTIDSAVRDVLARM